MCFSIPSCPPKWEFDYFHLPIHLFIQQNTKKLALPRVFNYIPSIYTQKIEAKNERNGNCCKENFHIYKYIYIYLHFLSVIILFFTSKFQLNKRKQSSFNFHFFFSTISLSLSTLLGQRIVSQMISILIWSHIHIQIHTLKQISPKISETSSKTQLAWLCAFLITSSQNFISSS